MLTLRDAARGARNVLVLVAIMLTALVLASEATAPSLNPPDEPQPSVAEGMPRGPYRVIARDQADGFGDDAVQLGRAIAAEASAAAPPHLRFRWTMLDLLGRVTGRIDQHSAFAKLAAALTFGSEQGEVAQAALEADPFGWRACVVLSAARYYATDDMVRILAKLGDRTLAFRNAPPRDVLTLLVVLHEVGHCLAWESSDSASRLGALQSESKADAFAVLWLARMRGAKTAIDTGLWLADARLIAAATWGAPTHETWRAVDATVSEVSAGMGVDADAAALQAIAIARRVAPSADEMQRIEAWTLRNAPTLLRSGLAMGLPCLNPPEDPAVVAWRDRLALAVARSLRPAEWDEDAARRAEIEFMIRARPADEARIRRVAAQDDRMLRSWAPNGVACCRCP